MTEVFEWNRAEFTHKRKGMVNRWVWTMLPQ